MQQFRVEFEQQLTDKKAAVVVSVQENACKQYIFRLYCVAIKAWTNLFNNG